MYSRLASPRCLLTAAICFASVLFVPSPAPAGDAQEAPVDKMQKVYDRTQAWSASFRQVYTPKGLPHKTRSKGKLYFQKPGLMRWEYNWPEKRLFVGDGKKLYFYRLEDNQVMVSEGLDPKLSSHLAFLFGTGDIRKTYEVKRLSQSRYGAKTDIVLLLTPKEADGAVNTLHMVIDPQKFTVKETVVLDGMGNKNHLRFSETELNPKLDEKLFVFDIPKSAEVIQAPKQ